MIRFLLVAISIVPLSVSAHCEDDPAAIDQRKSAHVPKPSFLDNGTIKIGVDLNLGGAISYLSKSGTDDNVVNNWDWGRQIQMSHYSGPSPFRVAGKEAAKAWANFPWNPVQAGDHFGFASKLLDSSNDGKELVIKSRPMQWSFPNVPSECTYETRITLHGPTARVRCKLTADRKDTTAYAAYSQELPAVYVNAPYYRLMSYTGDEPFQNKDLTRIRKIPKKGDDFPWANFRATEHWAAHVNDDGFGLSVYQPACVTFLGGFAGKFGKGGTKDFPTGYIAPVRSEILDAKIEYAYEYTLILGKLDDIRKRVRDLHGEAKPPAYTFTKDRQGWTFTGCTDSGWPIRDTWNITSDKPGAQLIGPAGFWRAESAPILKIEAAFETKQTELRIFWAGHNQNAFSAELSTTIPIQGDGQTRIYEKRLADLKGYTAGISQLRIDPPLGVAKIKAIRLGK